MRILLVEDDDLLSRILTDHLTAQRYVVDIATDGVSGLDYAQAAAYDLIVLDVNLPQLNGIQVCQILRQRQYPVPILLLTARGTSSDKVIGLDAGADDYVVKPCPVEEISARIRALLRRPRVAGTPVLTWGNLCLDPATYEVTCDRRLIALSPKEYGLLELFLRNPQRTFNSSSILEHLWSFENAPGEETVRTHIKRLRSKLKAAGVNDLIDTVYGIGYRLKSAPVSRSDSGAEPSVATAADSATEETARSAVIAAWDEFKQPILERVALVDRAVVALEAGNLPETIRQVAAEAAHKLAGSLAMFGFPKGSALGKVLEQMLQSPQPSDLAHLKALTTELHQVLHQHEQSPETITSIQPSSSSNQLTSQWLVVDSDVSAAQALQTEGRKLGIQIQISPNLKAARSQFTAGAPGVILLDAALVSKLDFASFQPFSSEGEKPFVVILTQPNDFADRLVGIRAGIHHFLLKSTPPDELLLNVQNMFAQKSLPPIKVLAVDDDLMVLNRLQECLQPWGINITTLSTPDAVLPTLESTQPDLLILDVEMPIVSGIELCQVIRSDRTWNQLPILFLTARQEANVVSQIYQAGADDYISKPFTGSEIITRISNRLKRNSLLKQIP
ncbi:MAG TPA: response regulator [Leptolyngbyaceae cyanobacterium M33_DOE_097]|uniref:Response regulator n=1 Tax=Oscillatoriales cyanobacterium SpSt-418 TaxID=2282169 RepID=A0A7C3PH81_9CYAN|nr:response regulator [Leptolyngbyaceae cyanobacterium M33_DOE_097]